MRLTQIQAVLTAFCMLLLPTITGCGSTGVASPTQSSSGSTVSASISPASLFFGNASVGTTSTKTVAVTNTGTNNLVISSISVSGSEFSVPGISFPLTIAPAATYTANVVFAPTSAGNVTGSASINSNLSGSPSVVALSGTGVSTPVGLLNVSPSSLFFGNVTVGAGSNQKVALSNTGNANVAVSSVSVSGLGFSVGAATPFTVAAGSTASIIVTFSPQTTGPATGTVTLTSDAGNSPAVISASGSGTNSVAHSVDLTWVASTSSVSGYNVYRGSQAGGPYQQINPSLASAGGYTDSSVASAQTYYYVVTAIDANGNESAFSNQAIAAIP